MAINLITVLKKSLLVTLALIFFSSTVWAEEEKQPEKYGRKDADVYFGLGGGVGFFSGAQFSGKIWDPFPALEPFIFKFGFNVKS